MGIVWGDLGETARIERSGGRAHCVSVSPRNTDVLQRVPPRDADIAVVNVGHARDQGCRFGWRSGSWT